MVSEAVVSVAAVGLAMEAVLAAAADLLEAAERAVAGNLNIIFSVDVLSSFS